MTPSIYRIDDPRARAVLLEALETGMVFIFPTDTIYGLGGNPWDDGAIAKVRALKGRATDQPFTLHLATTAEIDRYAEIPASTRAAVLQLLPGPYTLLLAARPAAPACSVLGTKVGIRVPRHPFFAHVVEPLGRALFGTSVNAHGEPPLAAFDDMIDGFPSIDLAFVGDVSGSPSDIIDLTAVPPRAVRGRLPASLETPDRD